MPKVQRDGVDSTTINKIAPSLAAMAVDIDSLVPDPENARLHPEENMEIIRQSLCKYGQVHPLLCREATRVIVAGNGRWAAAKSLGWTKIAAHFAPMSEIDAIGLGITDNRASEKAIWDFTVLGKLMDRLKSELGDPAIGWDDDYITVISEIPDWAEPIVEGGPADGEDRISTVSIKVDQNQKQLLETCIQMVKKRKSSPKKMTDTAALVTILNEWLS